MQLNGKRIFVVEDNLGTHALIKLLLEQYGAQVIFASVGISIIEALKESAPIDLIILDLMLWNGIIGHDLYDEIRNIPKFEIVPIIAVSAADPNTAIPETKSRGFSGFIGKPIDYNLFPKQIAQILLGKSIWFTRD